MRPAGLLGISTLMDLSHTVKSDGKKPGCLYRFYSRISQLGPFCLFLFLFF